MFDLQSKGDLRTAEDFYMRAILADPGDGEIMSLYANWCGNFIMTKIKRCATLRDQFRLLLEIGTISMQNSLFLY
jgi:hypothetical protein